MKNSFFKKREGNDSYPIIARSRATKQSRLSRKDGFASFPMTNKKRGFTLIEVIIASTIFTMVSLIGVMVFINVTRMQRRVALENAIFEDGRFMMERLTREIRSHTIDYEEYYNKLSLAANPYGSNYGCYASRFYNPGTGGPHNGGLGAYCSTNPPHTTSVEDDPKCVYDKSTVDVNTGQNPYQGTVGYDDSNDANAFCDLQYQPTGGSCTIGPHLHLQNELYLIDPDGKEKTILALKKFDDQINNQPAEYALSMVRIKGQDGNNDGINEIWTGMQCTTPFCCASGFDCASLSSLEASQDGVANGLFKGFVPITPLRTRVVSLRFYLSPLEDPRKAFNETALADGIQQQPHVTVVMVLQPARSELVNFSGDIPTVTLQTTVSSRVYNEVKSYGNQSACETY